MKELASTPNGPEIETFAANAEFVANLVEHGIRVLIVGGAAIRYYVPSRNVDDLDIMVEPSLKGAQVIFEALPRWNELPGFSIDALAIPGPRPRLLSLKRFLYLDMIVPAEGFQFEAEWQRGVPATVNHRAVRIAASELLVELKKGSERQKDVEDSLSLMGRR